MDGFRNTCMTAGAPDLKFASAWITRGANFKSDKSARTVNSIAWLQIPKFALHRLSGAGEFRNRRATA